MADTLLIPARFRGPPGSGNGGYTAGLLAAQLAGPARVRLVAPPPLDRALAVVRTDAGVELRDGEALVAKAWPASVDLVAPPAPSLTAAREAEARYAGLGEHAFPGCFVCGPQRASGDGLRIFPGHAGTPGQVACSWTPAADLADADGSVSARFVWAALDCPSGWAHLERSGEAAVLGEYAVRIDHPVQAGAPHILLGWQAGAEGRKLYSGSALYDAGGRPLAVATATWIRLAAEPVPAPV